MSDELTIEASASEQRHRLRLRGELDLASASDLTQAVSRLCMDGAQELEVDIGGLSFMDSTGLRALLTAQALCQEQLCRFTLAPVPAELPQQVRRLLEISGVLGTLPFGEDSDRGGHEPEVA